MNSAGSADEQALGRATGHLALQGFRRESDGRWHGTLPSADGPPHHVAITIPKGFPHVLPRLYTSVSPQLPPRPHIARDGLLCIAPDNVLLDTRRPEQIITEALDRARAILDLPPGSEDGLLQEFSAYWDLEADSTIWTTVPPGTSTGSIVASHPDRRTLLTPTIEDAVRWSGATRSPLPNTLTNAFFLRLRSLPFPPPFAELKFRDLLALLEPHTAPTDWQSCLTWLRDHDSGILLLGAPAGKGDVLFAVQFPGPPARIDAGFRPGKQPPNIRFLLRQGTVVHRRNVTRLDSDYLLPRAGTSSGHLLHHVVIVGCGAIGSQTAHLLASAGLGTITLVDHELLASANIHRHTLGTPHIGHPKALALKAELSARYPHLAFSAQVARVETLLEGDSPWATADLLIIAVGDDALELRLNALFGAKVPRLHAWQEPDGLGGHVLATGFPGHRGCFSCLYEHTPAGLSNMASLVAPGQDVTSSMGGCSGAFVPYSFLDATTTALLAARTALAVLRGKESAPTLHTWTGPLDQPEGRSLLLSERAKRLGSHGNEDRMGFGRSHCTVCGGWAG